MKFFVPNAGTFQQEQLVYRTLCANIENNTGAQLSNRRVHSISYRHSGVDRFAVVGESDPIENELILGIIFEPSRNVYHVCTPNRGLLVGPTILVGANDVYEHVDFDE